MRTTELLSLLSVAVSADLYVVSLQNTAAILTIATEFQDHHTISGGWGPFQTKFVVTGHEVIGKVVEVGSKVSEFKVGDRVGVGAQVGSCGKCKACKGPNGGYCCFIISVTYFNFHSQRTTVSSPSTATTPTVRCSENHCGWRLTPLKGYDGSEHQGGYSTHVRAQERFVFHIPESLKSTDAASMSVQSCIFCLDSS